MPYFPPVVLRSGAIPAATVQAQEFTNGIISPIIRPLENAVLGLKLTTASGGTNIAVVDTLNQRFGVGTFSESVAVATTFHVYGNGPKMRLQDNNEASSYFEIEDTTDVSCSFTKRSTTGSPFVRFDLLAIDGTSAATVGFFRLTNTTGLKSFVFYKGNNSTTVDVRIAVDGQASYFNAGIGVGFGVTAPTAWVHTAASSTARASLCLPHGSAPTSPVDGDMWTTTAGLFVRINGSTVGPLS